MGRASAEQITKHHWAFVNLRRGNAPVRLFGRGGFVMIILLGLLSAGIIFPAKWINDQKFQTRSDDPALGIFKER